MMEADLQVIQTAVAMRCELLQYVNEFGASRRPMRPTDYTCVMAKQSSKLSLRTTSQAQTSFAAKRKANLVNLPILINLTCPKSADDHQPAELHTVHPHRNQIS
mmetsp:Transcript_20382/g.43332  ORF Transcript_20382/g.43332 Transcript_20382/m.43332 type:complete len:104 (+) Transcript_20382:307-618(+)